MPEYELIREEGADHAKKFHVKCTLPDDQAVVEAAGDSRRKAEQAAARQMLALLEEKPRK
ncbi:putative dsRNA-binding protein [Pseudomonadota bacterium]